MSLKRDVHTFSELFRERRARRNTGHQILKSGDLTPTKIQVFVFQGDTQEFAFHVQQWATFFSKLNDTLPVGIITQSALTAEAIAPATDLPLFLAPSHSELEAILQEHNPGAILYVNNNKSNFIPLWQPQPVHIFIGHGESAKTGVSASNQLKAYDLCFVAGEAGRDRIADRLYDYDAAGRVRVVGRPPVGDAQTPESSPVSTQSTEQTGQQSATTVLYAPTWEGDRETNNYSSLSEMGVELVSVILATNNHRLVYRPHPTTGARAESFGRKNREIIELINAANRTGQDLQHIVDETPDLSYAFNSDVCIGDLASVTYDWLATDKPLLVTEVRNDHSREHDNLFGGVTSISQQDVKELAAKIATAQSAASLERQRAFRDYVHGETDPATVLQTWVDTLNDVITTRDAQIARQR